VSSKLIATIYLVCRLVVGGAFVYAGLGKVGMGDADLTAKLAQVIAQYGLLPWWAINITALLLPWLELTAGVLLVFGAFELPAGLIVLFMETVTTVAVFITLVRGLSIRAGAFSLSATSSHVTWGLLLFNLMLIAMTVFIVRYAYRRERYRVYHRES
jgi:putative oxidoreductase